MTAQLAYVAAVVLAALFAWAGVAKLGARARTARTFRALGLPAPDRLAVAVPAVELAVAAGLLLAPGWAAAVALALLAAFSVFLARAVRAGVDAGCGCFGSAATEPVSGVDLLRNGLLAAAGVTALATPHRVVPHVPALLVGVATTAAGAAVLRVARRRHQPAVEPEGPPVGTPAPTVDGVDYGAAAVTVVAFAAPGCPSCAHLRRPRAPEDADVVVHVVELAGATRSTFYAFGVRATPFAAAVDRDGVVRATAVTTTAADLTALVERVRT